MGPGSWIFAASVAGPKTVLATWGAAGMGWAEEVQQEEGVPGT